MIMKKQLLMISLFFALGMFCACSNDDEMGGLSGDQSLTGNSGESKENTLAIKELLGEWELCEFDKGMAQWVKFKTSEVLCRIGDNGIIEVINRTDVDLSPLADSGFYPFQVYTKDVTRIGKVNGEWGEITTTKDFITIDGIEFSYSFYDKAKNPPLEFGFYHNDTTEGPPLPNRYIGKDILMIDQGYDLDGPMYIFTRTK